MIRYDNTKAARILSLATKGAEGEITSQGAQDGITYYKTMEETAREILADFSQRGW
jgi:hypothetical protein